MTNFSKPPPPEDKGPEIEEGRVVLDFYNSDVFLKIEDKGMTGSNRVESGFSQLWTCGSFFHASCHVTPTNQSESSIRVR